MPALPVLPVPRSATPPVPRGPTLPVAVPEPATPAARLPPTTAPLGWLVPVPRSLPLGVRPTDLGPVGWQALVRDGVLVPVWGDVAAPAGRPAPPALRAAALRALVPPRAVLGRAGAVWVHTAGPAPARFDVLVEPRVRRPSPHPARVPHECPLPAEDVVRLGDVRVTTVQRTALDVARWLGPDAAAPLLHRLLVHAGLDARDLLARAAGGTDRRLLARVRAVLDVLDASRPADPADPPVPRDARVPQDREAGTPAAFEPVMR